MKISFLSFVISISLVSCNCPAGTTNFNSIHQLQYNFTEHTNTYGFRALQGPSSGDVYHTGRLYGGSLNTSFFIRFSDPSTIVWSYYYENVMFSYRSLCIDPNEDHIYSLELSTSTSETYIYGFHANNGTLSLTKQINDSNCGTDLCWLHVSTDNVLYGSVFSQSNFQSAVFKYASRNDTSVPYFLFGGGYSIRAFTWLNDSDVFCMSYPTSGDVIYMARTNMTSMTNPWYMEIACTEIGTCSQPYYSSALYSSDQEVIYFALVESSKILFFVLNASGGTPSSLHTANNFGSLHELYQLDSQKLLICFKSSNDIFSYLYVYHISNSSFTQYKFTNMTITIRNVFYSSISSRLVFYGEIDDQNIYVVQTLFDSILDFDDVNEETTQVFNAQNVSTLNYNIYTDRSPTNGTLVVNEGSSLTTVDRSMNSNLDQYLDVVYYLNTPSSPKSYSLAEGWSQTLSINITCSINGSTSLEYSIEDYENYTAPTWIALDSQNNQFNYTTPEVAQNTDHYFTIKTNELSSSVSYNLTVKIEVLNCEVANCDLCQVDNGYSCHTCSSGYEPSGTNCEEIMPEEIENAQIATQAIIGISMGVAISISMINFSSPVGIWSLINLFQMLMLLILTGAFIPETVREYMSGMDFAVFNFDFIPFIKIPPISFLHSWMKFGQNNGNLQDIGVDDGSTLINNIAFLVILMIFIAVHIPLALVNVKTRDKAGKCNKVINIACKTMTFTVYIRLIIENFQFMFLCSISEVYNVEFSNANKQVSLFFSHFFMVSCLCFFIFIIYQFQATRVWINRKYYSYSEELFTGLKESNKARLYPIFLTTRRLVFCIILICAQDQHFIYRVVSFSLIQIIYFALFIVIRPFSEITNNLVEANNEFLLTYMILMLLYYNKRERWDNTIEKVFVHSITSSSSFTCLILTTSFILSTACKLTKRKSQKTQSKHPVNADTVQNELGERNGTPMVNFDHQRVNLQTSQSLSRIGSKFPNNTES